VLLMSAKGRRPTALNKAAASGVDGITAAQYQGNLESNIQGLAKRLENGSYRANEPKWWHNAFA
jgi:hypothetical protein